MFNQKDITQQSYSDLFDYPSNNNMNNPSTYNLYPHIEAMSDHRKINLPKTFTTKKGPLILFSEEPTLIAPPHSLNTTHLSLFKTPRAPSKYTETKAQNVYHDFNSLKTIGDLRKSILEFGSHDNSALDTKRSLNDDKEEDLTMPRLERKNTLESMSFNKINLDEQTESKIRPGLSAKRYLSNWTRHWKPQLYESLANKGAIKRDNNFEPHLLSTNNRQRIDDDITLIPPAYRIQRQWLSSSVTPLKVYRFYRAQSNFLGYGYLKFL